MADSAAGDAPTSSRLPCMLGRVFPLPCRPRLCPSIIPPMPPSSSSMTSSELRRAPITSATSSFITGGSKGYKQRDEEESSLAVRALQLSGKKRIEEEDADVADHVEATSALEDTST